MLLVAVTLGACQDATRVTELAPPGPSLSLSGASITVNSLADPGDNSCDPSGTGDGCTLREALATVEAGGTITFGVSGTITLAAGALVVAREVTITGPAAAAVIIDAHGQSRVLETESGADVSISDLTMRNGFTGPADGRGGGCLLNSGGHVLLTRVVIERCDGWGAGGGIGNAAGTIDVQSSIVRSNWASNGGGGIYNNAGATLVVESSTVKDNEGRNGGGIGSRGFLTVNNSTISGNSARLNGGGIFEADRDVGSTTVTFNTIAFNTADSDNTTDGDGGGIFNSQAAWVLVGNIVANNADTGGQAPDCGQANPKPGIGDGNLVSDLTGCGSWIGDAIEADPSLGALADNGGPTPTHALSAGSPAVDAYSGALPCPTTDQRGVSRPQGLRCDIGALELTPMVVSIDIRPGSSTNPIAISAKGVLPVAILSTATFDASSVDVSTVQLDGVGVATRANGAYYATLQDVDADGLLDLVVMFNIQSLDLASDPTEMTLTGYLSGGAAITGTDAVTVVP